MDTYDMEVECGMYCQGGSVKGVLEPYGYGSWVKVEDAESLTAEVDARDATITALLEMLRPKGEPMKYMLGDQKVDHDPAARVYARALEIAGRAE